MGFYFRKSINVGALRFNLSKSGVGISAGVRGFRVGTGPRGNYIHMGRNGFYYRATLPPHTPRRTKSAPPPVPELQQPATPVESADAQTIVDSSSVDLVREMNEKWAMQEFSKWVAALAGAAFVLAMIQGASGGVYIALAIVFSIGYFVAMHFDSLRRTTVLMYNLDPEAERRYQRLDEAWQAAAGCDLQAEVTSHAEVSAAEAKYHAGAVREINRKNITISRTWPSIVKSNILPTKVTLQGQQLYFFPDKLFIIDSSGVGAVAYDHLVAKVSPSSFIERGPIPRDAKQVSQTWEYVNKGGGPDRRFKNNRQLPVMLYEHLALVTESGLHVILTFSKQGTGEEIARAIREVGAGSQEIRHLTGVSASASAPEADPKQLGSPVN